MENKESEESPESVLGTALAVELGLGFIAIFLGWLTSVDVRYWIPRAEMAFAGDIAKQLAIGAGLAIPMVFSISLLERIDWKPIRDLKALEDMPLIASMMKLTRGELIAISIAAGVGEEMLLRGWLMGLIMGTPPSTDLWVAPAVALVVSSVVFGFMHPITPAYIVIAALMGACFGGMLLFFNSLIVPIAAHATYDAIHLWLAKRDFERKAMPTA